MNLDWLYGVLDASFLTMVVFTLAMTHVTIVTVTVFLHRHAAHRAVELHPALKHFFRFWLWLTTGMVTRQWAAVHRKHHAKCETEEDPHSPQVMGLGKVLWEGAERYREGVTDETVERYGKGLPDDWIERHVYTPHPILGLTLMALIDLALFGVAGITVWAVQMLWIPFFAAGVINGIGHYWGYRNFECPDAAKNIAPWGILIGGEELHNNHHTYPNSAKLSVKPWEFDIGWFWIRLFQAIGLAKPLSTGPIVARDPAKKHVDMDTVWAVLNDRFRVMSRYAEDVIAPAVEHEYHRADTASRALFKRAKSLLCREEMLVDDAGRARISKLVDESPMLKTLYELRLDLQKIWAKRGGDSEELLKAFRDWCHEAESTGIAALREFVAELKSYTVPSRLARA